MPTSILNKTPTNLGPSEQSHMEHEAISDAVLVLALTDGM